MLRCLLVITAVLWCYSPVLNGTPVWDDEGHLTKASLRGLHGLMRIWMEPGASQQYYPVVHTVFWLQDRLWGASPAGHHILTCLCHLGAAFLLWRLLRELAVPGAGWCAACFALHPVHVESVAWISELKNTLSACLYLGAAILYLRFDQTRRTATWFLALLLFLLALGTKSITASLPAALLVVFWWKRGRITLRRDFLPLLPLFAAGIASGLLTIWMEREFIGAKGLEFELSWLQRLLIAGRAVWFYLGSLVWPAGLTFIYPRWDVGHAAGLQWLFVAAFFVLLGLAWSWRRRSRGPLAALLFFTGTLFPALGFINVYPFRYSFVADHFQYLASIGPLVVFSWLLVITGARVHRLATDGAGALCLAVLGLLTWKHASDFRDGSTLWRATLQNNPGCWLGENNLGQLVLATGDKAQARKHFERAVELNPRFYEAINNLASLCMTEGRVTEAEELYQKVLELNPTYVIAHSNLGLIMLQKGRVQEALEHESTAAKLAPDYAPAHGNYGLTLLQTGRVREAIASLRKALAIDPNDFNGLTLLPWVLATAPAEDLRNPAEALQLAKDAVKSLGDKNATALNNLAAASAANHDMETAVRVAREAREAALQQNNGMVLNALQVVLPVYESGRPFIDLRLTEQPKL
jgi:tetratricopeptide (TPR) repeat protein